MSHRLVNKILHKPTLRLKHEAAYGDGPAYTSTVRQLFDLDPKKKEESFRAESRVGLNGRSQYVENLR
jgi:glutamyl-tRNA reductase